MPNIRVEPLGISVEAPKGAVLRDVLYDARILLDYPCGGRGRCHQCRVSVADASGASQHADRPALACQLVIQGDCTVTIPPDRFSARIWKHGVLDQDIRSEGADERPSIKRVRVGLSAPTLEDQRPDWERLADALKARGTLVGAPDPHELERLSIVLREGNWTVDAVCDEERLLRLDAGGRRVTGFAIDLGTTTVDIALVDLETRTLIGRKAFLNKQVAFGADVISRALSFHDDRGPVREAGLTTIEDGAWELLEEAGENAEGVLRTVVVGNPIMMHILHGIDPWQLTRLPYIPVTARRLQRNPHELGWSFQGHGLVETLPLISAYVGADTVGMIVALGLDREKSTSLSIDIGTNGEIVLSRQGSLLATSTAAGPAFEGAQISCGMRALPGAIVAVDIHLDGVIELQTVEDAQPQGICGTGLVSAVAQLLERGVVDATGRLLDPTDIVIPGLRDRIFSLGGEPAFALTQDGRVSITQKDIRTLQLAKGAVRAGIDTLLATTGIQPDGLDALRLAGNFGAGLDARAAMRIGLVPPMEIDKVQVVGNAALRGAVMSLLSHEYIKRSDNIAKRARFIELGGKSEFQAMLMEAMLF